MIEKRITSMLMAILLVMTLLPLGQASSPLTSRRVPLSPRRMRRGTRAVIRSLRIRVMAATMNGKLLVRKKN